MYIGVVPTRIVPKGILALMVTLVAVSNCCRAQFLAPNQPEQDACGAIMVCGNFNSPYVYQWHGEKMEQVIFSYNYNNSLYSTIYFETNPWSNGNVSYTSTRTMWLKIKAAMAGDIIFTITPHNPNSDYDFFIYNASLMPYSCDSMIYNSSSGVRFNENFDAGGLTGLAFGTLPSSASSFGPALHANAGEEFLILVVNKYQNMTPPLVTTEGFSIDFTGSTAALANDSIPYFSNIRQNCDKSSQVTVRYSEPIACSSIAPDGSDFYITPPLKPIKSSFGFTCSQVCAGANPADGYSRNVTVKFDGLLPPGTYFLHTKIGSDGNSVNDLCGASQSLQDSIAFTVDPYTPLSFTGIDSPACRFLRVGLSHKVMCDSIATDGSDFMITGPSTVTIAGASGINCDEQYLADTVLVEVQDPIAVDGIYYLVSKTGSDNNTLLDSCYGEMAGGTKIAFTVNSYADLIITGQDTVLCKGANTLILTAKNISWQPEQLNCGALGPKMDNGCFELTKEVVGMPGTSSLYVSYTPQVFASAAGVRTQMLFKASELLALGFRAGQIKRVGWVCYPRPSTQIDPSSPLSLFGGFTNFDEVTIKMGCTAVSGLQTMDTGLAQVFHTTHFIPTTGLHSFFLDNEYTWDGVSNVIIEVCTSAPVQSSFTNGGRIMASQTNFVSSLRYYSWTLPGCSLSASTASNSDVSFFSRLDTWLTVCSPPEMVNDHYHWSPQSNILETDGDSSAEVYSQQPTVYTVQTTDPSGCFLRDTFAVRISTLKPIVTGDTVICFGDSTQLTAVANTDPAYFSWIAAVPGTLSCLNCEGPMARPKDSTAYRVAVTDQYGCIDTAGIFINSIPLPKVTVAPHDTIIKYGSSIQLKASGADIYGWAPAGSLDYSYIPSPMASPQEPTVYILTGILNNGCRNFDTAYIDIDYDSNLFIPTVFSPNSDGKNDRFKVANLSFQRVLEFKVFNRWGQVVFSALDNRGWDGTLDGAPQDMGVYQYLITLGFPNGHSKTYKGNTTLIR